MLDKGVLAAVSERCDDYIKFIDLVEMQYADRLRKVFVCVGEHGEIGLLRPSFIIIVSIYCIIIC